MDDDFRKWVINKALKTPVEEMCQDVDFMCRILSDVNHGRSHRFNKSSSKEGSINMIEILEREYMQAVTSG